MKNMLYVLGKGRNENTELFAYLEKQGYHWISPENNWADKRHFSDINVDHSIVLAVNVARKIVEPVPLMMLSPFDIENYMKKAIPIEELKKELSNQPAIAEALSSADKDTNNLQNKNKNIFVKITGKQIICKFPSKKLDDYGNPRIFYKIRLPSPDYSLVPLTKDDQPLKNATVLVPDYIVMDDKFNKKDDGKEHKLIGIRPQAKYIVLFDGDKRSSDNHIVEDSMLVYGDKLKDAFKYKFREKSLSDRLNKANKTRNEDQKDADKTAAKESKSKDKER